MTALPQPARLRRDIGLRNVSKATRWAGTASVGLTALFATLAAGSLPGHRAAPAAPAPSPSPSAPAGSQSTGSQSTGSQSTGSQSPLQPAAQTPATTTAPPLVVSGGS